MKKKIALFLGLLLAANVSYAELKIGVVNIAAVLEKAPQAEAARKHLEQKFSSRAKQLETQMKDIQTMEEKMTKDAAVMSESEKANLEKDLINKKRDAKRSQQEYSEDLNTSRNEELGKLQRRILEVVQKIAKEQNFDLLLAEGVIYANSKIDVTEEVQRRLLKPE
jgi:outer membrane protein